MVEILPEMADDLLSSVDQPLGVQTDESGREYLVSSRFFLDLLLWREREGMGLGWVWGDGDGVIVDFVEEG